MAVAPGVEGACWFARNGGICGKIAVHESSVSVLGCRLRRDGQYIDAALGEIGACERRQARGSA
jgi:hypothetical protein